MSSAWGERIEARGGCKGGTEHNTTPKPGSQSGGLYQIDRLSGHCSIACVQSPHSVGLTFPLQAGTRIVLNLGP